MPWSEYLACSVCTNASHSCCKSVLSCSSFLNIAIQTLGVQSVTQQHLLLSSFVAATTSCCSFNLWASRAFTRSNVSSHNAAGTRLRSCGGRLLREAVNIISSAFHGSICVAFKPATVLKRVVPY